MKAATFCRNLVTGGPLASPWGMAIAPAGFGPFGGDLLVGNFSFADSEINAFDATTGKFEGTIPRRRRRRQHGRRTLGSDVRRRGSDRRPDDPFPNRRRQRRGDGLFAAITVPEPSTWAMMLLGFGGLALLALRRGSVATG